MTDTRDDARDDTRDDTLDPSFLARASLPESARRALADGIPRELRLPGWRGPTLFTSEVHDGRLVSTTEPGALVRRSGELEGYILGSVREPAPAAAPTAAPAAKPTAAPTAAPPYSAFVVRHVAGDVYLLDAAEPAVDRYVMASVPALFAAMHAFASAWPLFVEGDEGGRALASFRALLERLDPAALADPEHYWPGWLLELE